MADDTDTDTDGGADANTGSPGTGMDVELDLNLPEYALPVAVGVLTVLVLVLGYNVYATQQAVGALDSDEDPTDTSAGDSLQERLTSLEEQHTELQKQVACQQAADEVNDAYCRKYVRGSQGTDRPTTTRCGNTRDMQSRTYAHSASEMGCDWTEQLDDAGTVTVNGETIDCVADGYLEPTCPA